MVETLIFFGFDVIVHHHFSCEMAVAVNGSRAMDRVGRTLDV